MSCDISLQTRKQWLDSALTLVPAGYDRETLREHLSKSLPRCRATTPKTFSRWIALQLKRLPDDSNIDGESDIAGILKPVPCSPEEIELIRNGEIYLIKIGTSDGTPIIWKVPATQIDFVRQYWPVTPKKMPTGGYAVYSTVNGKDTPLHRIWLNASTGDHVGASDGDFLNWCDIKARVIVSPRFKEGVACLPGCINNTDSRVESERMVSNLYLVSGRDNPNLTRNRRQEAFEKKQVQPIYSDDGDPMTPLGYKTGLKPNLAQQEKKLESQDVNRKIAAIRKLWGIKPCRFVRVRREAK